MRFANGTVVGRAVRAAFLAALLADAGCGYHFPGQGKVLPGGGSRVRVASFENRTGEVGLENDVTQAMEEEIARRGVFTLARDDDSADLVLEGVINSLETHPVAFSSTDAALQYETVMVLSAKLRNPHTGAVVWRVSALREDDSYGAVSSTVVTASPQFQQQTLSAADLAQLPEVQLSESQRREALDRVLENASRDLYNGIVEDF
jgi:outer membrane lipopolysaccharide assembly protein LptE/RlpB